MGKRIKIIIVSLFLASCGPRDEAASGSSGPSFIQLKTGEVLEVSAEGEQLTPENCKRKDGSQDIWKTIRLFKENQNLYSKAQDNRLKVILGRARNCLQVSTKVPVEYVLQNEDGKSFANTGVKVLVTKLQVMNIDDLLKKSDLMTEFADGMGVSVSELVEFLKDEGLRGQVSVTYVQSANPDQPQQPSNGKIQVIDLAGNEGQVIRPDLCGTQIWQSVRIFQDIQDPVIEAITDKKLKLFLSQGDKVCLAMGEPFFFEVKNQDGKFEKVEGSDYRLVKVIIRNKDDFLGDPMLRDYVSRDMNLSLAEFESYLQGMSRDQVNLLYFNPVGDQL
ncbi:MAG: hypothetical protein KDD33_04495 [Bdellovibrionales bacterium]|nr:hypothetical protein [Bdellovibrionales bacterium]